MCVRYKFKIIFVGAYIRTYTARTYIYVYLGDHKHLNLQNTNRKVELHSPAEQYITASHSLTHTQYLQKWPKDKIIKMNISLSLFSAAAALKQISYFFLLFGSVGHCCLLVGVVTFQHLIKINRFDTFKRARVHRTLNTHCVCVCLQIGVEPIYNKLCVRTAFTIPNVHLSRFLQNKLHSYSGTSFLIRHLFLTLSLSLFFRFSVCT